jgi:RHS repeat-associated protein
MVNQVTHANNTKVLHGKDPFDMGRPAAISLQRTADSSVLWQTGTYAYDGAGNVKQIGSDWYTYDKVNRLSIGTTSGATKRQCASYNAFGTINGLGTGTTTCSASSISVDNATNRMTEAQGPPALHYDAAGNMTAWGGYAYSWDRLNQMLTTSGTGFNRTYAYTTDGERMVDRNNQDSTRTLWIRDLSGKVLREYSRTGAGTWSWSKDYVYRNGLHAATVTASATRHFALDHLGTLRRGTDTQATPQLDATLTRDFYPFGLEATSATGAERMRFTGHQRDTFGTTAQTDDLDYMHARYYNPNVARFLSTDPVLNLKRTMKRPQAWNRYAYVLGNPMKYVDPTGEIFKLAGCGGADTSQCDASKAILKQALGDAYQYVNVGKGGIVTLAGISAGGFANLGTFQKGLGALMGSNNTFTLFVGSSPNTSATNPAQTTALRNFLGLKTGDARIDIDPRYLPQSFGNVPQNAATSLVHEVGHGAGMLFPAQATMVNNLSMGGVLYRGEGYPTTFENRYRSEAGLPLREYYLSPGDYTDPGDVSLFP